MITDDEVDSFVDLSGLEQTHKRISPYIHRTPVLTNASINKILEANIFFKCENFQKAGAFKSRGAVNAVFSLDDQSVKYGVCTHSSGNHAQALARACALRGIPSYIVMPENAPRVKVNAVKEYGGEITFCKPTLKDREDTLALVMARNGAIEIHPYNNYLIIAGQATCAKEIFEDIPLIPDIIMTPVGGGGLLSGTSLCTRIISPETKIIAAEPEGANDAWQSFKTGMLVPSNNPKTIADGLLTSLGSLTWPIIKKNVDDIMVVNDNYILIALKMIWERMKIVIEPSAALPLAVLLKSRAENDFMIFKGKNIAMILSGGNIDPDNLPW